MAKRIHARRHAAQAIYMIATNGYAAGFLKGRIFTGATKSLCVPGLNCYSCPGAFASCPVGALQSVLTSAYYQFSFYVLGFLLIFGALMGRFVCGFLCPFGLVQDLLFKLKVKRKLRKLPGEKALRSLRYAVLLVFVIWLPLTMVDFTGQGAPWFCKYICPSGTLFAGLPLLAVNEPLQKAAGWLFALKAGILAVLLVSSAFIFRPFCRYLCPLGAIYGLFNPIALYRYRVDERACVSCGACHKACNLDIHPNVSPNSPDCIRCGACKNSCPRGAIHTSVKSAVKRLKLNTKSNYCSTD